VKAKSKQSERLIGLQTIERFLAEADVNLRQARHTQSGLPVFVHPSIFWFGGGPI